MMKVVVINLLYLSAASAHIVQEQEARTEEHRVRSHPKVDEHSHPHPQEKAGGRTHSQHHPQTKAGGRTHPHHHPEAKADPQPRGANATHPLLHFVYDDFEVDGQNLCGGSKTFEFGECTVSFALEDLNATEFEHVYEARNCGDHEVVVIMDMADDVPMHAMTFHPASMDWKELVELPSDFLLEGEELGCMFGVVTNLDLDPVKVQEYIDTHGQRRRLHQEGRENRPNGPCPANRRLGQERSVARTYAGANMFFPSIPENRRLASCSSFKVLKLGLKFDAAYCAQTGGTEAQAKAYLGGVLAEMNKYFEPMCIKVEGCSISGSCASNDPLKAMVDSAPDICSSSDSVLDQFLNSMGGNLQGCHAMHMIFGGNAADAKFDGVRGCAETCTLCEGAKTSGVNNFVPGLPMIDHVALLAHEFGHNIGVDGDYYPPDGNDETYFMGAGITGFKPERQQWIVDFVNAQSCVGSVSGDSSPTGPNPTPAPVPNPTEAPYDYNDDGNDGYDDGYDDDYDDNY